jgi:O-acetyl-ADP-ribose deacetylase (regulator of RNase III)
VIRVVVDDLASVRVDAVVRPASTTLEPYPPANQRLEELAAPAFEKLELREELAVGSAVVTDAGDLPAGLIIHAIVGTDADPVTADAIRRAVASTLHRAAAWQIATVGLPPLGSGTPDLPPERVAAVIMTEIRARDMSVGFPSEVVIVVGTEGEKRLFERLAQDP